MTIPSLLHTASYPSLTQDQVGVWTLYAFLAVLAIGQILQIIAHFRRKPPLETEIHERAKALDTELETRLAGKIIEVESRLDAKVEAVRAEARTMNQDRRVTIGSLFGKLEDMRTDFDGKYSSLTNAVNQGFRDVERSIGRLESPTPNPPPPNA